MEMIQFFRETGKTGIQFFAHPPRVKLKTEKRGKREKQGKLNAIAASGGFGRTQTPPSGIQFFLFFLFSVFRGGGRTTTKAPCAECAECAPSHHLAHSMKTQNSIDSVDDQASRRICTPPHMPGLIGLAR
jgi:hypothetical protein